MPPPKKDICDCRVLEFFSKEPDHPIRWDESLSEYFLACGQSGRTMIYYCLFCGGSTPKSRRASLFAHVSQMEMCRIHDLFRGLRTVADVVARFGPPDEEREVDGGSHRLEEDGRPERGECYRALVYKSLSPVADIGFQVGVGDLVQGTWSAKQSANPAT